MDPIQMLLIGVIAPGALALGVVALVLFTQARFRGVSLREQAARPSPATGAALAAGYGLAFALILGWPALLPVDVTQVGPWLALAAVPLGFLAGRRRAVAVTALGLAVGLFLAGPAHAGVALAGHAALVALTFGVLDVGLARVVQRTDSRGGAVAIVVFLSGAAAALMLSDTASLAQTVGGLAAATGALMVAGFLGRGLADLRHATPVLAAVVATNLHAVTLYASGRYEVLTLLALAPLALAFVLLRLRRREGRLFGFAAPAALIALPIALAGALAARSYFAEPTPEPAASGAGVSPGDSGGADYGYD